MMDNRDGLTYREDYFDDPAGWAAVGDLVADIFGVDISPLDRLGDITCLNTPGTIDSDYRGEVKVLLVNLGEADFAIERGMRIAQMVIAPVVQARVRETTQTAETKRGSGGFGSTGV